MDGTVCATMISYLFGEILGEVVSNGIADKQWVGLHEQRCGERDEGRSIREQRQETANN